MKIVGGFCLLNPFKRYVEVAVRNPQLGKGHPPTPCWGRLRLNKLGPPAFPLEIFGLQDFGVSLEN